VPWQDVAPQRAAQRLPSATGRTPSVAGRAPSLVAAVVAAAGRKDMEYYDLTLGDGDTSSCSRSERSGGGGGGSAYSGAAAAAASAKAQLAAGAAKARTCCAAHGSLLVAMLMCQVGMILFNFGLTYGFSGQLW
jgi:hypothetical protein